MILFKDKLLGLDLGLGKAELTMWPIKRYIMV